MIYVFGWLAIYTGLLASRWRGRIPASVVVFSLVVIASIAVLRGQVGTDTESYEYWSGAVRQGLGLVGAEPGFTALLYLLTGIFDSDRWVVRSIAFIYGFSVLLVYRRADQDTRFVLLAFIIPACFYLHSMNVLRLGLAAVLLMLAALRARGGQEGRFLFFGAAAVTFHYTSALAFAFLWLMTRGEDGARGKLLLATGATAVAAFLLTRIEWITEKVTGYGDLGVPDEFSGLSQIAILALLLVAANTTGLRGFTKLKLNSASLALAACGWLLARQSYAGLRVLDLLVFSFPLALLVALERDQVPLKRLSKLFLLMAGLLSMAAQLRGFLANEGQGATPFLPYTSILWE